MRRQETQSTRKTSLGSLDPIEKAVVAKFRANLSDHIADSTKHITWGIPLPYGAKLWHFDGSLVSTDGISPESGAVATLRPGEGRFGGCVAVEEETTNLIINPLFKNGLSRWWNEGTDSSNTIEVEDISTPYGDKALVVTAQGGTPSPYQTIDLPVGTIVTVTVMVRRVSGEGNPYLRWGAGYNMKPPFDIKENGKWYTFSRTGEVGGNRNLILRTPTNANARFEYAFVQLEEKPFATSFVDGTRAAGRLSYPKSLIAGLNALTIAAWTPGPPYWISGNKYLVIAQTTNAPPYGDVFSLSQAGTSNNIQLWVRNDASASAVVLRHTNVWDGNWHFIVGVINKSPQPGRQPIELYVDGQLVASSSNANAVPDLSNIDEAWGVQVGSWRDSMQWNGLIDELLVAPFAATPEQIQAWYAMGAPFWDPWVGQR